MITADYIVVGSGLTGATLARILADNHREVVVLERRSVLGGNIRDELHESGIRFNLYGPHYFRTGSSKIWDFVRRFAAFQKFEAKPLTFAEGRYWNWPLHQAEMRELCGADWERYGELKPSSNFEEAALAMMPGTVYQKFVKGYTEKQWGVPGVRLDASLAKRFDVRKDDDRRLSRHRFQGIPVRGYSTWIETILAGIPCYVNSDYLTERNDFRARKCLIFTGPIDEYFGFKLGKLRYRGQRRKHQYYSHLDTLLPGIQVNYPDLRMKDKIRSIEWKYLLPDGERAQVEGTLVTDECPFSPSGPSEYEYPFPDDCNRKLYEAYRREAASVEGLLICGRLGEYRYYDMDQAIGRAMVLARQLIGLETVLKSELQRLYP